MKKLSDYCENDFTGWQRVFELATQVVPDTYRFRKQQVSPMFACDECRFVWQTRYLKSAPDEYYEDFPRYGLEVKTCLRCKEKSYDTTNNRLEEKS